MKFLNKFQHQNYFKYLPQETKNNVKEFLEQFSDRDYASNIKDIECLARDGFSPHSYNLGGLRLKVFTNLYMYKFGNVSLPKEAAKVADKYVDLTEEQSIECFKDKYKEELKGISKDKINYHDLIELDKSELAEELDELHSEALQDDYSSIYSEVMVMWDGDKFTVTLQHCIEDAPYHRKQNFIKEWTLSFKNKAEIKRVAKELRKDWIS